MEPTRLVVGLGNPGDRYRETRHNLGFRVVDELSRRHGIRLGRLECNAVIGEADGVTLARPQTYMNRSGYSVRCLAEKRGLEAAAILVVYDEVRLPLGRLRFRQKGGPGGHRGMESVIHSLRTEEVARLRLGVGRDDMPIDGDELVDYVLSPFDAEEREAAEELVTRAADACEAWLEETPEVVANRFNG